MAAPFRSGRFTCIVFDYEKLPVILYQAVLR